MTPAAAYDLTACLCAYVFYCASIAWTRSVSRLRHAWLLVVLPSGVGFYVAVFEATRAVLT